MSREARAPRAQSVGCKVQIQAPLHASARWPLLVISAPASIPTSTFVASASTACSEFAASEVAFDAATGLHATAITQVQAQARRRLLRLFVRCGQLASDNVQAIGQWEHGGGFSVDMSLRIAAADRTGRERLLRYCARRSLALDRLHELDPEHLRYQSTKKGPGGNGPQLVTPLERIDRLAKLVPPPRIHRHRYFGVLVRTAAHGKFPRQPVAGLRRHATLIAVPLSAAARRAPFSRSPCRAGASSAGTFGRNRNVSPECRRNCFGRISAGN